jgi:hypothetical protein
MTLIEQRKFDRAASAASKKSAQEEAELEAQLDAEVCTGGTCLNQSWGENLSCSSVQFSNTLVHAS